MEARRWPAEHVRLVAEKFRDHWLSASGQKGVKLDWEATWRNWVRNEGDPPTARASPRLDAQAETLSALTGGLTNPKPRTQDHESIAAYLPAA